MKSKYKTEKKELGEKSFFNIYINPVTQDPRAERDILEANVRASIFTSIEDSLDNFNAKVEVYKASVNMYKKQRKKEKFAKRMTNRPVNYIEKFANTCYHIVLYAKKMAKPYTGIISDSTQEALQLQNSQA